MKNIQLRQIADFQKSLDAPSFNEFSAGSARGFKRRRFHQLLHEYRDKMYRRFPVFFDDRQLKIDVEVKVPQLNNCTFKFQAYTNMEICTPDKLRVRVYQDALYRYDEKNTFDCQLVDVLFKICDLDDLVLPLSFVWSKENLHKFVQTAVIKRVLPGFFGYRQWCSGLTKSEYLKRAKRDLAPGLIPFPKRFDETTFLATDRCLRRRLRRKTNLIVQTDTEFSFDEIAKHSRIQKRKKQPTLFAKWPAQRFWDLMDEHDDEEELVGAFWDEVRGLPQNTLYV